MAIADATASAAPSGKKPGENPICASDPLNLASGRCAQATNSNSRQARLARATWAESAEKRRAQKTQLEERKRIPYRSNDKVAICIAALIRLPTSVRCVDQSSLSTSIAPPTTTANSTPVPRTHTTEVRGIFQLADRQQQPRTPPRRVEPMTAPMPALSMMAMEEEDSNSADEAFASFIDIVDDDEIHGPDQGLDASSSSSSGATLSSSTQSAPTSTSTSTSESSSSPCSLPETTTVSPHSVLAKSSSGSVSAEISAAITTTDTPALHAHHPPHPHEFLRRASSGSTTFLPHAHPLALSATASPMLRHPSSSQSQLQLHVDDGFAMDAAMGMDMGMGMGMGLGPNMSMPMGVSMGIGAMGMGSAGYMGMGLTGTSISGGSHQLSALDLAGTSAAAALSSAGGPPLAVSTSNSNNSNSSSTRLATSNTDPVSASTTSADDASKDVDESESSTIFPSLCIPIQAPFGSGAGAGVFGQSISNVQLQQLQQMHQQHLHPGLGATAPGSGSGSGQQGSAPGAPIAHGHGQVVTHTHAGTSLPTFQFDFKPTAGGSIATPSSASAAAQGASAVANVPAPSASVKSRKASASKAKKDGAAGAAIAGSAGAGSSVVVSTSAKVADLPAVGTPKGKQKGKEKESEQLEGRAGGSKKRKLDRKPATLASPAVAVEAMDAFAERAVPFPSSDRKSSGGTRKREIKKQKNGTAAVQEHAASSGTAGRATSLQDGILGSSSANVASDELEQHSSTEASASVNVKREMMDTSDDAVWTSASDVTGDDSTAASHVPSSKRPPPSAPQVTEAGNPFPVIDTSAPHSSLFIHPDTSGLTKREARLVKNRAAAFLSRQRKREQFEELDAKCKSLCRLAWKMWEAMATPTSGKTDTRSLLASRLSGEAPDVVLSLQQIIDKEGAPMAPTEEGPSSFYALLYANAERKPGNEEMLRRIFGSVRSAPLTSAAPATPTGSKEAQAYKRKVESELALLRSQLQAAQIQAQEATKREEETRKLLAASEMRFASAGSVPLPPSPRVPMDWQQGSSATEGHSLNSHTVSLPASPDTANASKVSQAQSPAIGASTDGANIAKPEDFVDAKCSKQLSVPHNAALNPAASTGGGDPAKDSEGDSTASLSSTASTSTSASVQPNPRKGAGSVALLAILIGFAIFGFPGGASSGHAGVSSHSIESSYVSMDDLHSHAQEIGSSRRQGGGDRAEAKSKDSSAHLPEHDLTILDSEQDLESSGDDTLVDGEVISPEAKGKSKEIDVARYDPLREWLARSLELDLASLGLCDRDDNSNAAQADIQAEDTNADAGDMAAQRTRKGRRLHISELAPYLGHSDFNVDNGFIIVDGPASREVSDNPRDAPVADGSGYTRKDSVASATLSISPSRLSVFLPALDTPEKLEKDSPETVVKEHAPGQPLTAQISTPRRRLRARSLLAEPDSKAAAVAAQASMCAGDAAQPAADTQAEVRPPFFTTTKAAEAEDAGAKPRRKAKGRAYFELEFTFSGARLAHIL
ncbi:hypothetical protein K437DRAFT_294175 [Tilletiaria anomala UBC 951]|uniref:BZIP domain-containing protein n=1 Tax=Tilletiaria anomala (strain ATCC 24038 / CBS 436.72 / UBC 951) TaxID=1037660 RepID=A0A066W362_TILAU|nr:uncharacterized protein K437DRAFT_294175 [Tilletiaria anomala UBC 951]KDN46983.1 hypothetical protein K437DRAFT_294175 [Tilletiaria anomala UBC 951]